MDTRTILVFCAFALALTTRTSLAQNVLPDTAVDGSAANPDRKLETRGPIERMTNALQNLPGGMSLSGFFDAGATNQAGTSSVSMGDFELDLAREFGKTTQISAAVVMNDEGPSLAVGFVDVHLFGGMIAPRGRLPIEKGFHVQIGRFDVPFGQDWQYFASKDRTELSAPLTTETIMDGGYNDTGLRILGNTQSGNYSAFVLRGHGPGHVFGGRLGLTPFDSPYRLKPRTRRFEAGVSMLRDLDGRGGSRARFLALDSEAQLGPCRARAEHLRKKAQPAEGVEAIAQSGWHFTVSCNAAATVVPFARLDTLTDDPSARTPQPAIGPGSARTGALSSRTSRFTAGLNATILGIAVLKVEYQRTLAAPFSVQAERLGRDTWRAQVVVFF